MDLEARRRATSVYVPGAVEPMLPEALSNDACSLVPGRERLAVTVELELRGAEVARAAFYRSVIRSDERLDYERVDRIFAGGEPAEEPWAAPLAAAREAAAALQRGARAERRAGGRLRGARVRLRRGRATSARSAARADRVPSPDRAPDDRRQRGRRRAAAAARRVPCLYRVHERPEPERIERLAEQLASLEVPTPALPERMSASQAAELVGAISRRVDEHVRAHRSGPDRAELARAALAQAGLLLAQEPRPRRPALGQLLPLHLADPPLPRPRLPPRAAVGGRRRGSRPARRRSSPSWGRGPPNASARR